MGNFSSSTSKKKLRSQTADFERRRVHRETVGSSRIRILQCVRYSANWNDIDVKDTNKIICICENSQNNETQFYSLRTTKMDTILFQAFDEYLGKQNGKFSIIGMKNGRLTHSFITKNNNYIIVFNNNFGYNVYNILNDCWLLTKNNKIIEYKTNSVRSLLINDEILI